jgi:hypothetical protein
MSDQSHTNLALPTKTRKTRAARRVASSFFQLERRPNQTERLVTKLRERLGEWVPLPELLDIRPRIAQFSARIYEARHKLGLHIENKVETINGEKHSWFRLLEHPAALRPEEPSLVACTTAMADTAAPVRHVAQSVLFGDLAPEAGYPG